MAEAVGITAKDVHYIADLARLALSDQDTARLTKDLGAILGYIGKLQELEVHEVPPTSHVLDLKNVYRDDHIKPSLPQEEALSMAVARHEGAFKVPQVIE